MPHLQSENPIGTQSPVNESKQMTLNPSAAILIADEQIQEKFKPNSEVMSMPKCHVTGLDVRLEDAYILNKCEASYAIRDMRAKIRAIENLVADLGELEKKEMTDRGTGKQFVRLDSRLVCARVAEALTAIWPERKLFIKWIDWREQRRRMFRSFSNHDNMSGNGEPVEAINEPEDGSNF
jgi:hypothetical protein